MLFVEKQAIITRANVKSAMRSPQQVDALDMTLTEEGGKKLGAATKDAHGDMRIGVLISLVTSIASAGNESASIEANCSVVAILAANFPEIADLKKSSEGGINLFKLRDALKPYLFGEKPFPDAAAAPGK